MNPFEKYSPYWSWDFKFNNLKGSENMGVNKIIKLNEYKTKKAKQKKNNTYHINKLKKSEEDDRKNTFNLFMRVLSTIKEESN